MRSLPAGSIDYPVYGSLRTRTAHFTTFNLGRSPPPLGLSLCVDCGDRSGGVGEVGGAGGLGEMSASEKIIP